MRNATVKICSFDELTDEAKERAHSKWLNEGREYFWDGEARNTIKAFEREFNVKITDWEYSSCGYNYRLDTSAIDDDVLALSGNRARAWFWNNYEYLLMKPTAHYWTHDRSGKLYKAVSTDSRKYVSKCFNDRVYDGTCPLTGYYLDCNALDPIAYFCFGVKWSEKEKRRVQSTCRTLRADNANTVESLLDEAVDSLFAAVQRDCEYQDSMAAFAENCAANGYEFTEDGEMWTGAKEVAA